MKIFTSSNSCRQFAVYLIRLLTSLSLQEFYLLFIFCVELKNKN